MKGSRPRRACLGALACTHVMGGPLVRPWRLHGLDLPPSRPPTAVFRARLTAAACCMSSISKLALPTVTRGRLDAAQRRRPTVLCALWRSVVRTRRRTGRPARCASAPAAHCLVRPAQRAGGG